MRVVKRTGEIVDFDRDRIAQAIMAAVSANGSSVPRTDIDTMSENIVDEVGARFQEFFPNVENIQDIVEKHLVLAGHYEVAKSYILYRAERQKARSEAKERAIEDARMGKLTATTRDGRTVLFNVREVESTLAKAARGLDDIDLDMVLREVVHNVYDGIPTRQIQQAMVLATAAFIERDPEYSRLAARLQLDAVYREVIGRSCGEAELDAIYRESFKDTITNTVRRGRLAEGMLAFDLELLANSLKPERDDLFQFLGAQTLYDRYLLRNDQAECLELPQGFWMRVAMGLAIEEPDRNERALEFYNTLSQLHYVASTPTLFHAGTSHPQLSSCYLTTIDDHLSHIFKSLGDNAQLSKWSGGIGNDWSNIRATGAHIQSTNVNSQGVVPFLKIANDVTMAINRSGKRRGATCAYLETWHYDIEDFLDLRKNTGDDRRRTHDMNTANWIPDLFMKRVAADEDWSLFSPNEVPELHHTFGREFEKHYKQYEAAGERGELRLHKKVRAQDLWRKMLTMLFETGHPWITFKDPCNIRSPQDHVGVVHSSNLCTEITLNTSADETAVCNLGSVNLSLAVRETADGGYEIDEEHLAKTVSTAIRMLDNVIDINFYPTEEARNSNLRHRPIGLGCMGFQDLLFKLNVPFASEEAIEIADRVQEVISYHAILTSSKLAAERGSYPSYEGSKWSRGLFPIDTVDLLEKERGVPIEVSRTQRLDWQSVREHVRDHGIRNSNMMAIAPTATISNISGCFPCIEPIYKNIYVKANISGEFTIVNSYLVQDLKALGLWNQDMLDRLKYADGNLEVIPEIPEALRTKYKEAFEIDAIHCLRLTAARGKWIDQSASHNVFLKGTSGKKLAETYMAAWRMGLKTTYYLRSLAATQVEKSTLDAKKFGYTQKREYGAQPAEVPSAVAVAAAIEGATPSNPAQISPAQISPAQRHGALASPSAKAGLAAVPEEPKLCRIDDPDCEACQ